jgi:Asp-tRNA(Asn)/Glu-tRNA(Gln) amidotransferase A subunit family amidase
MCFDPAKSSRQEPHMTDPSRLGAGEAAARIARGELTSVALVQACLDRIAERERTVRAWRHLDTEQALAQAHAADRSTPRSPLHGVPVGIKDIIDTQDMPTRYGSPIYERHQPAADASCVALLRRAGAVIMGKTVTTEFAFMTPRETRNPHNPEHTPGGSSSGSAAAVADFMVPLAYGTQTAGSVIRPASFCGVVAYKGSFGALPMAGIKPFGPNLDTLGVFARTVADTALVRQVLSGAPGVPERPAAPPRVGICRTYEFPEAEPCVAEALETAAAAFAKAGATVAEVTLPDDFAGLVEAQHVVLVYEGARAYASEYLHSPEGLSPGIHAMIEEGLALPHPRYAEAWALCRRCQGAFAGLLGEWDTLVAPSAPGEAPAGLGSTGNAIFNRMWTFLHAACVNLPVLKGPQGLPVGVQAVGAVGGDDRLLGLAAWLERALAAA